MKDKLIKWLGGYTKDDVLAQAMKDLFNTVTEEDILREVNGAWFSGERSLNEQEVKLLIAEAEQFTKSRLWKELRKDIQYQANRTMFEKSRTEADMIAGKMALYILDCIKTRLESLKRGRGIFNVDA
jgi:hypothetical protein